MHHESLNSILQNYGVHGSGKPARTLVSSVTTAWGVDWDERLIARDLMQNFFDANRGRLAEVSVAVDGSTVRVTAPAAFNLDHLFYLGSEKTEDDVGKYGEGFKVAATCLLRDHGVTPVAASGRSVLVLRVAAKAVDGTTNLYPVEYDFYETERQVPGAVLLLHGCKPKLIQAMREGLTHFFHEANPLLGAGRWSDYTGDFAVYDSTDGRGHVFYRKLKRGEVEGIPLVLVINKKYESIEKKIRKDRDRNAFGGALMEQFFNLFARYAVKDAAAAQRVIVEAARPLWPRGHPLLSQIASADSWRHGWPAKDAAAVFGDTYFARSSARDDSQLRLQVEALERRWAAEGRLALPEYFRRFGVVHAVTQLEEVSARAKEESRRNNQRPPSPAEASALEVLKRITRALAPAVMAVFDSKKTSYTVAATEAVLGELRRSRHHNSCEVFLAAEVFVADFARALATFLHEHVHIFGYDGSRGFTDALTSLLETVVRQRGDLDPYEAEWKEAGVRVERERETKPAASGGGAQEWLARKGEAELRELLARLPEAVIEGLRKGESAGNTASSR
jgi:hypothetical protein